MPKRVGYLRPPFAPQTKAEADRDYNRHRRDLQLKKLYGSARWQKFQQYVKRRRVLCEAPWCEGMTTLGVIVHHKVDPRDDLDLAFDEDNVLFVCRGCHNRLHAKRPRD